MDRLTKEVTVSLVVKFYVDQDLFSNIEGLKDRAMEQGEVVSCVLSDLPKTIDLT